MNDFGFREWPFANVPTIDRGVSVWADRTQAKTQVDEIFEDWGFQPQSTITLIWADLGAGKTHTLYYLKGRCDKEGGLVPFYVLLPAAVTDFVSLYRMIARSFDWSLVAPGLSANPATDMAANLGQTMKWRASSIDTRRRQLAQQWLQADRLTASQCQTIGVSSPIRTADDAVEVLRAAIQSMTEGGARVVLMIDEYQRVAEGRRRQLQEIGHAIHTLYNACPIRLSLVLSCATGGFDDYTMVLTPEIVSRLSPKRVQLHYLSSSDALDYVHDLFAAYRDQASKVGPFYPLTESSAQEFAEYLVARLTGELTPRRLNMAYSELLGDIRAGRTPTPCSSEALKEWLLRRGPDLVDALAS